MIWQWNWALSHGEMTSSFKGETVLLCSWSAPGCLFHNQSTVSDYRLWRTKSRTGGEVTLALSRSARLCKDNRLTDSPHEIVTCCSLQTWTDWVERKFWFHLVTILKLKWLCIKGNKSFFVSILTVLICLSFRGYEGCAALRATKAIPKQDLHVNQMDSAWVAYLPGHEIRCK